MNITPMNITPMNITPARQHTPILFSGLTSPAPRLLTDTQTSLLSLLEQMPALERQRCVVHSLNPCPEYLDDLWQLGPGVLLIGPQDQRTLDWALERTENKPRYRETNRFTSSLIPSERALLRYLPGGLSNKHIAKRLGLSDRTVRNRLVDIGEKLGLANRTQIAMYYAGQWQWLERYREQFAQWNSGRHSGTQVLNAAD
jgi:DNA-binding CsgD family transcriptional regulator